MTAIPDAALDVIRAAIQDADQLDDTDPAARVAQYLISSGYRIAPDTHDQPAAA